MFRTKSRFLLIQIRFHAALFYNDDELLVDISVKHTIVKRLRNWSQKCHKVCFFLVPEHNFDAFFHFVSSPLIEVFRFSRFMPGGVKMI